MRVPLISLGFLALSVSFARGAALDDASPREHFSLMAHVEYLASDALEGREPGTKGYDDAAAYVVKEFKKAGLKPGADGAWFQMVPLLVSERYLLEAQLEQVSETGERRALAHLEDFIAAKPLVSERIAADAPAVFAGYGVVDEESGYDDYGSLDVKGKIVAVFAGAPKSFDGARRAYLGDSDIKRENAAARGAVGMLVLPTEASDAQTPWEQAVERADSPAAAFLDPTGAAHVPAPSVSANARLSAAGARALLAGAETGYDELRAAEAQGKPLHGFEIPGRLRYGAATRFRRIESANVVGLLKGSDRALRNEVVVISAHLDHLGKRKNGKPGEDLIRNGAMDNAMGVAMLIDTAKKLQKLKPRRSVVFVAFTGEEKGLLGSKYFAQNPPLGARTIISNVNLDMPLTLFPLGDVIGYGAERSSLGALIESAAGGMGLALTPDPYPEEGIFTRSDHFSFVVHQGVPAVFLATGVKNGGEAAFRDFLKKHYHRPSDDLSLPIDWTAAATFAELNVKIAQAIADADAPPAWNPGDYFGEKFGKKKQ